jgi:general secretion pathway protein F
MRFAIKAVNQERQVVTAALEAADEAAAREVLRQRGLVAISVSRQAGALPSLLRRRASFPAELFSVELLALLDAGLNVVEALQALAEKEAKGDHRQVLAGILDSLNRGESLSQAFTRFPNAFSQLYVATIRSSEQSGNLNEALARFIAYQEELGKVRKKVVSALLYPAILMIAGGGVLAFLMFYVVPRFAKVYEDISTELPFFSGLLLTIGRAVGDNTVLTMAALGGLIAAAVFVGSKERFRAALVLRLWNVPGIGERMRVYQLARFYRTVGMLLRAGIPAVRALEMVGGLLSANLRGQLDLARTLVQEGKPLSSALASAGLVTPVAARMLRVGERSGQMGELMDRAARFCDEETARFIEAFTKVFEPALMAVLGIAIGGIVVLMYMPVFELAGSLQ